MTLAKPCPVMLLSIDMLAVTSVGLNPFESSGMSSRCWYAAYTFPRHEKLVAKYLQIHDVECFLPLYSSVHKWKNRTSRHVQLPLFPSYVFVRLSNHEFARTLSAPGVLSLVGKAGKPAIIRPEEVEMVKLTTSHFNAEPHPFLAIGQRVRVTRGPLSGLEGILIEKRSTYRVVLSMNLIMQAMSVEIDVTDVESVASH